MGNQGSSGLHKRERTGDRSRLASSGFSNAPPGSSQAQSILSPGADSRATNHHRTATSDDGCPVQVFLWLYNCPWYIELF